MNFKCPHCGEKAIPAAHKLGANPTTPAKCVLCGKLSSEPMGSRALTTFFFGFIPLVVIFYAITVSRLWPVYLYFSLAIVTAILWFVFTPLRPVTDAVHRREIQFKRAIWIGIGILVVVGYGIGFFNGKA